MGEQVPVLRADLHSFQMGSVAESYGSSIFRGFFWQISILISIMTALIYLLTSSV
jgi:hypothetical protein